MRIVYNHVTTFMFSKLSHHQRITHSQRGRWRYEKVIFAYIYVIRKAAQVSVPTPPHPPPPPHPVLQTSKGKTSHLLTQQRNESRNIQGEWFSWEVRQLSWEVHSYPDTGILWKINGGFKRQLSFYNTPQPFKLTPNKKWVNWFWCLPKIFWLLLVCLL